MKKLIKWTLGTVAVIALIEMAGRKGFEWGVAAAREQIVGSKNIRVVFPFGEPKSPEVKVVQNWGMTEEELAKLVGEFFQNPGGAV